MKLPKFDVLFHHIVKKCSQFKSRRSKIVAIGLMIFVAVLVCVLIFKYYISTGIPLENWTVYVDPQNRFAVLVPAKPKEDVKNDIYSVSSGDATYTIKVISAASSGFDSEVKKIQGRDSLIYEDEHTDATQNKYVDFKVQTFWQIKKGRIFLFHNTIYVLLDEVSISGNDENADKFNNFLSSFQLNL